jgi:hypothetical protein
MNEKAILMKLIDACSGGTIIETKVLDKILLEEHGNKYDAGMHCNSMLRRGLIDYQGDGDWEIFVTKEELEDE